MKIQIAENIKKFRVASGYTQSELAILLSVTPQAVSRWENGQALPDITLLPLLAKYLDVSIDVMVGVGEQKGKSLEKELRERKQLIIEDENEKRQNQQRIFDIYEELARTKIFYLIGYFQYLMRIKHDENYIPNDLEERLKIARQMMRDALRMSNMCDRIQLLSTIASYEDEDKLTFWSDEYELPEYINTNFWDQLSFTSIGKLPRQSSEKYFNNRRETIAFFII